MCDSPFAYDQTLSYSSTGYTLTFEGGTTVQGYSTPSVSLCAPCGYSCTQETCLGGCICNKWKWCKCCTKLCDAWGIDWCDCVNTSVTLWPTLTISASIDIPMTYELAAGYSITVDTPLEPIETVSYTFEDFTFNITVNGTTSSITIPCTLEVSETNGSFETTVPITSISESYSDEGIDYSVDFSFNFLLCLTPENGIAWLNIQVVGSLTASYENIAPVTTSFTITCPIVGAE
jgi:hypothetical protein